MISFEGINFFYNFRDTHWNHILNKLKSSLYKPSNNHNNVLTLDSGLITAKQRFKPIQFKSTCCWFLLLGGVSRVSQRNTQARQSRDFLQRQVKSTLWTLHNVYIVCNRDNIVIIVPGLPELLSTCHFLHNCCTGQCLISACTGRLPEFYENQYFVRRRFTCR